MKTRWWVLILIFSLAINAAFLVICGYQYYRYTCVVPSARCPLSPRGQHLYQALGLSGAQLERMEPLARTFHAKLEKLSREMESKRELFVDLLNREDVAPGKIEGLRKDMAGIQDRIQREVIAHILDMKRILKPGQKEHFFRLLRKIIQQEEDWFSKQGG